MLFDLYYFSQELQNYNFNDFDNWNITLAEMQLSSNKTAMLSGIFIIITEILTKNQKLLIISCHVSAEQFWWTMTISSFCNQKGTIVVAKRHCQIWQPFSSYNI